NAACELAERVQLLRLAQAVLELPPLLLGQVLCRHVAGDTEHERLVAELRAGLDRPNPDPLAVGAHELAADLDALLAGRVALLPLCGRELAALRQVEALAILGERQLELLVARPQQPRELRGDEDRLALEVDHVRT